MPLIYFLLWHRSVLSYRRVFLTLSPWYFQYQHCLLIRFQISKVFSRRNHVLPYSSLQNDRSAEQNKTETKSAINPVCCRTGFLFYFFPPSFPFLNPFLHHYPSSALFFLIIFYVLCFIFGKLFNFFYYFVYWTHQYILWFLCWLFFLPLHFLYNIFKLCRNFFYTFSSTPQPSSSPWFHWPLLIFTLYFIPLF